VTHTTQTFTEGLPIPAAHAALDRELVVRSLRLNCLTEAYAPLWASALDGWSQEFGMRAEWATQVALRTEQERWRAQAEIDSLACLAIGMPFKELLQIYRSHFPVLRAYEREKCFDASGHAIARDRRAFGSLQVQVEEARDAPRGADQERVWDRYQRFAGGDTDVELEPYTPPFAAADREAAMSDAYWTFVDRYGLMPPDGEERLA
jgi:hypothetical protein